MVSPSSGGVLRARQGLERNPRLLELQRSKHFYGRRGSSYRMSRPSAIVYVIDDDPSIRQGIKRLLGSMGLEAIFCESAKEFIANRVPSVPSCMILEVRLRGTSGLDLQDGLNEAGVHTPLIFLTSHGDIPMAVRAMKAGAVTFLTKPYRDQDLLDSVQEALVRDEARRHQEAELSELRERFESLTPRERDVLPLVTSGLPSKKIAAMIGTSVTTVKVHRSKLRRKIGAASVAELVKMATKLDIARQYQRQV
jgi:RNA polymerase sigma factor (sigma-70 family)